jgi:hypothetical protein
MGVSMAVIRSVTDVNVPRRIPWRVIMPKKISVFSRDPEVGVKCSAILGVPGQPRPHVRVRMAGVVGHGDVQFGIGMGGRDLLQEPQERLVPVPG